jgi:hypothetical protein
MPLPLEFVFFGLTLAGVALFHKRALFVSLAGLSATVAYKVTFTGFKEGAGLNGLVLHFVHEWVMLANLMLLLVGLQSWPTILKRVICRTLCQGYCRMVGRGSPAGDCVLHVGLSRQHCGSSDRRRGSSPCLRR